MLTQHGEGSPTTKGPGEQYIYAIAIYPEPYDVAQAMQALETIAFDTNRTVQFPTHTTAYPSCTGYQKSYYDGAHARDIWMTP